MARATSRTGVPHSSALEIAKWKRKHESLVGKNQASAIALRKMVAKELIARSSEATARSYLGYRKIVCKQRKVCVESCTHVKGAQVYQDSCKASSQGQRQYRWEPTKILREKTMQELKIQDTIAPTRYSNPRLL